MNMLKSSSQITWFFLAIFFLIAIISCCLTKSDQDENINSPNMNISGDLIIFYAGSLSLPFKNISKEFKKEYPDINILMESAGSVSCARKITDLERKCDIIASADYKVIDDMLIPKYADWNIKFASNEMAIVYHEESRYADEINKDNWYDILLNKDVAFGRSDPNSDPCGYRSVLMSKLAEKYYNKPELADKLLDKDLNYIRPKETDLLALLETNTIDYIFLYRSVAEQHKLKYLLLPDEINLKKQEFASYYKNAAVDINGKKPGEIVTIKGQPMVYGITILKDAPNYEAAVAYITFLLSEKGIAIMENNGQPSLIPSITDTYYKIPENLKRFAKK